ncbi:MAG TPA: hypothetical protein VG369_12150 [Humibacter sp.]|jgi:hypothetical protein|nr:hypothetical protein [Humibacter sp.]
MSITPNSNRHPTTATHRSMVGAFYPSGKTPHWSSPRRSTTSGSSVGWQTGDGRPRLHLSQKVPRYPSKAERRAGLELRWPDGARDVPIAALFADVVNVSDERWTPLGIDNFRTIGVIEPGRVPSNRRRGHFFGWVADGRTGFILDPGEYARVSVDIPREAIAEAHEGEYSVSAVVHSFGLWAAEPLVTTITASDIAAAALRRRARRPPPPSPNGDSTH